MANTRNMKPILLCLVGLLTLSATAQNIKRETVAFQYESKPSTPFTEDATTYDVFIVQSFKEGYEETIAQWERDCEAAQVQYDKEMEVYNAKSTGAKILEKTLLDESKPKLILPPKPQLNQKIWEETILGAKVDMTGMNRAPGGVEVTIELMGYENTTSELKKDEKKTKEGAKYYEYSRSLTYRHIIRYAVNQANGEVLVDEILPASETYKTYASKKYKNQSDLNRAWNETSINNRLQGQVVDGHMAVINNILNDRFCFYPKNYSWTVFHAKTTKKADYTELTDMAFEVKYAMEDFYENSDKAKAQLEKAVALWESMLEEANYGDKKARVNRKMAGFLFRNLITAHIWLENYDRVGRLYDDMRRADVKNSAENSGEALENFAADQKARHEANQ